MIPSGSTRHCKGYPRARCVGCAWQPIHDNSQQPSCINLQGSITVSRRVDTECSFRRQGRKISSASNDENNVTVVPCLCLRFRRTHRDGTPRVICHRRRPVVPFVSSAFPLHLQASGADFIWFSGPTAFNVHTIRPMHH